QRQETAKARNSKGKKQQCQETAKAPAQQLSNKLG
ncbi:MAG: hypothetical protein ACI9HK_002823, partial [Pirellulaceae bacterium]